MERRKDRDIRRILEVFIKNAEADALDNIYYDYEDYHEFDE